MSKSPPASANFFQNEEVFRALIDNAPVGMVVIDTRGRFVHVNRTFTHLLGYTLSEVHDLETWRRKAYPDPDYRAFVQQEWQSTLIETPSQASVQRAFRVRSASGEDKDIEFSLTMMPGEHQLITLSDVTARVQAVAELKASEHRFHSLYSAMTEGVALHRLVYDQDGKPVDYVILDVNSSFEAQTGLSRQDVVGRVASEAYKAGVPPYLELYAGVVTTGLPASFETHFEPMNRHFSISVFSHEKDCFATVFEDITAHHVAEDAAQKQLDFRESLMDSIPGVFYAVNAIGEFIFFNKNLLAATELSADEIVKTNVLELFSGEDKSRIGTEIARTFVSGSGNSEATLIGRKGRRTPFYFTGRRILFNGEPTLVGTGIDISERQQAERAREGAFSELAIQQNAMRELLAINESILQNALVGIIYLKHRVILSCNKRAEEIFGYVSGELIGRTTECLYESEDAFLTLGERCYPALAFEGATYSEELLLRRKDGPLFWGALTGRAVDWRKPNEGSIWIYADISERRAAEQESEKLRTAVEQAPVSIIITDRQGNIDYVNPGFTRITGYTADDVIGANPRMLKADNNSPEVYTELWQTVMAGKIWRGALCNRCKDGRLIWEDTSVSPIINAQGETTHFIAVKEDVTERRLAENQLRESEEVFRHLFEGVHDPLLLIQDGRFIDCNAAAFTLLAYPSKAHFLNKSPSEISPPVQPDGRASDEKAADILHEAFSKGSQRFEWLHLRFDGSEIPVEVTLTPITLRGQSVIHTSWRDITERKRIELELETHQTQLESLVRQRTSQLSAALAEAQVADRTKDEFLANISHELRTPLSAMIGFSTLARPLCTTDQLRDYLGKIANAGTTLSHIINDLLDLSKIAAGRLELESGTFSLRGLIDRCNSVMAWKAEEKGLKLVESVDVTVPDVLVGDSLRLEQIVLNLLSNAIKFTSKGGVALHVGLRAKQAGRLCLQIRVDDTGIGMTEDQIPLLFKPFSQTDASIGRRFGGTGLGLAICKRLVEMMDGTIAVKSTVGVGSSFRATIWFQEGQADDILFVDRAPTDLQVRALRYEHTRLLVVDDQPLNREVVTGLLRVVGIKADTAEHGREAINQLIKVGPAFYDMVLMDVQMPVLDGLSATQDIRARPEFDALPIVAMTAHTMAHEREHCRRAGMNDHIGKPFDEASFYAVLSQWISPVKQFRVAEEIIDPALPNAMEPMESIESIVPVTSVAPFETEPATLPTMEGIDTQTGLALLLGNVERYRYWLLSFVDDAPRYLDQLRQALAEGRINEAGIAAHTLKGRAGMLGMRALHDLLTRLDADIDVGVDVSGLLPIVAQDVAVLCEEITRVLGTVFVSPEQTPLEALPEGPPPASVQRLLALLEAGDSDSDTALETCLIDQRETKWAPHLERAKVDVARFDFAGARKRLSKQER